MFFFVARNKRRFYVFLRSKYLFSGGVVVVVKSKRCAVRIGIAWTSGSLRLIVTSKMGVTSGVNS